MVKADVSSASTRAPWLRVLAAAALAIGGLVLAMALGGSLPTISSLDIPQAPVSVQWLLPVLRTTVDLVAASTVGLLLAAAALLPSSKDLLATAPVRAARLASWLAWSWALLSLVQLTVAYADTFATSVSLDPVQLWSFASQSQQGAALVVSAALAAIAGVVAQLAERPVSAWAALVLALLAALPPAFTGHAAAAGDHDLATSSLVVHVLAVSLWVGGLLALVWYARVDGRFLPLATRRFSAMALWAYLAVGISGVVNASIRLEGLHSLTTPYGTVLLMKVFAFVALGILGWAHRRHTLRQIDAGERRAFAQLALVEAAVMVVTLGVAVGLAATRPPSSGATVPPSPAEVLLGSPMPDAPSLLAIVTGWRLDLLVTGTLLAAGVLYARGLWTLHRRGDRWAFGRSVAWYAGLAIIAFAALSGLAVFGRTAFSLHMAQHMVLSMVAPLLLVLGAPMTLALRALPAAHADQPSGPREWLLALLHSPFSRALTHPVTAFALFVSAPYMVYFSGLFETAMRHHWAHELMHVHFVLAGYLFFESLIGTDPIPYRAPYPMRLVTIFATLAFHAFFAVALMSTGTVIAATYFEALDRPWWPDLLADQTGGSAFTWAFGELPGVIVLVVLLVQWSQADDRQARREDRKADRDSDAELTAYNQMLAARRDARPR